MTDEVLDFDQLWNYDDPAATEQKFRDLLPDAEASHGKSYYLQLLTQIARTQGLQRRFEDAHKTLDSVLEHLNTDEIVKIRYLLERGRVFNSSQQRDKALPLFIEAYETGLPAQADFYTIDAGHMIAIADPENALDWNLKALELAEKSGNERAQGWKGSLYNNIGWTYYDLKQYEKALDIFQKALIFREQQGKENPIRIARWCIGKTLRALNRITEALAIQRELEAGDHDGFVDEEIAECLLALGKNAEARPYFRAAYDKLSQDTWFVEAYPERLERLKTLGNK